MGGVVGGDGVDRAVGQPLADGGHVGGRAQRRIDLEHGVVAGDGGVGEGEVVGRRFGSDRQPFRLGPPHRVDGPGRRQVQEVDGCAGQAAQGDVPLDHHRFGFGRLAGDAQPRRPLALVHLPAGGQGGVLAVLSQGDAQRRGVLQSPSHQPPVLHPGAVVGEQAHPQRGHLGHRRQLGAGPADGDGAGHPDVAQRAGCSAQVEHLTDDGGRVDDRLGVGHGHDRGAAAQGRGSGAGLDRLRLLPARLPQMGVQVDQPRRDDASVGVESSVTRETIADGRDLAGDDQHVGPPFAGGVDHGAAADEQRVSHLSHGAPPAG